MLLCRKRARTARGRMVVRPRWPGEDTTPSASHDDSDAYSSPDEASPWTGDPTHLPTYLLTCLPTYYTLGELHGAPLLCATSRHLPIGQLQGLLGKIRSTLLSSISCCNLPL